MEQKELENLQAKYKLTEEEYQEYYHAVNLFFTTGKSPVERPKIVFVSGQAGAGKSRLIPLVNQKLEYNAVISDYDIIRSMHPRFELASKTERENVHLALLPDADRANEDLRVYCRNNRINLINEGTMRGTAGFIKMARDFKEAGYEVDLELMSVPKIESYASTFLRYAMQLVSNDEPRLVPKEIHDSSYDNFLKTIQLFEEQELFDHAIVYRRGEGEPIPFYSTEGREFDSPSQALVYGRENFYEEFMNRFPMEYEMIRTVFSNSEPRLLPYLDELAQMYEAEENRRGLAPDMDGERDD